MFLLWLQISWMIVLVGAEISQAYQNSDYVDDTRDGRELSISRVRLLALAICRHAVQLFKEGRPAQTTAQIAKALTLSPHLVDNLSELLVQGNILVWIDNDAKRARALQPARDIGSLTVNTVIAALEDAGSNGRPLPPVPDMEALSDALADFRTELDRSATNRLIMDV
jgi:membrane protein